MKYFNRPHKRTKPIPHLNISRIIPDGGDEGQVLTKASGDDNDVTWANSGGVGSGLTQQQIEGLI